MSLFMSWGPQFDMSRTDARVSEWRLQIVSQMMMRDNER